MQYHILIYFVLFVFKWRLYGHPPIFRHQQITVPTMLEKIGRGTTCCKPSSTAQSNWFRWPSQSTFSGLPSPFHENRNLPFLGKIMTKPKIRTRWQEFGCKHNSMYNVYKCDIVWGWVAVEIPNYHWQPDLMDTAGTVAKDCTPQTFELN